MIDNFDLISQHLEFESPDDFYFVQAFVRGKDGRTTNPDGGSVNGNNKNRLVRFWTIRSVDELFRCKPDITGIADAIGARVYIHPTKRSFKDVAKEYMRLSMDMFLTENFEGMKGIYSSACGISYNNTDKKYLVDVDEEDLPQGIGESAIRDFIEYECEPTNCRKVLYKVPTKHGYHLIVNPFNVKKFTDKFPTIVIHKNNPTLLYFNK